MQIKMVVTDLDGTLLREDKTISERSLSALKQCRERGIKVVYATGRGGSATFLVPEELFDGKVCANGAKAFAGNEPVYNKLMPSEHVRDLLIAADNVGVKIVAESGGWHYGNFDVTETWSWLPQSEIVDFVKLDIEVEKIYAILERPEDAEVIKRHLPEYTYLYLSRDGFAMVMHKDAVKSKALAALAAHWSTERSDIVSFGDDTNDIELLKYSGVGIAMGNALDEVKSVADEICDANDNDGIAKWLEECLKI